MTEKEAIKEFNKKIRKRFYVVSSVILALIVVLIIIFLTGSSIAFRGINAKQGIQSERIRLNLDKPVIEKDKDGYWNIKTKKYNGTIGNDTLSPAHNNTQLKILQLTDIHFGSGLFSVQNDKKTIDGARKLVEWSEPDLIVVTGDAVYPVPYTSGSINNKKAASNFIKMMNSFKIPWAFVYGNHDTEDYALHSKDDITKLLEGNAYNGVDKFCLYQQGPIFKDKNPGERPQGNYPILIRDNGGNLVHVLMFMDSNKYNKESQGPPFFKYDCIHQDQVDWYKDTLTKISLENGYTKENPVTSSLYFHIPMKEYKEAWTLVTNDHIEKDSDKQNKKLYDDLKGVKYYGGDMQEYTRDPQDTTISASTLPNPIWDAIQELKSTKFLFCGHDHDNNFSVEYKGVRLTYGKSLDYQAYPGITNRTFQRGGSVILLTGKQKENAVKIYQKKLAKIGDEQISELNTVKTEMENVYRGTPNPKAMHPLKKIKIKVYVIIVLLVLVIGLVVTIDIIKKKKLRK